MGKIWRIGFLTGGGNRYSFDGFRQGLRELGYVEGNNIAIIYLSAEGNQARIPDLVAELMQLKVNVLVTTSPGVRAAKTGDQDDSHCHGDSRGSSRDWASR